MKKRMHLGVFFNHTGHHIASWRHPDAQADAAVNLQHYIELAKLAETACLDFCFFADVLAVLQRLRLPCHHVRVPQCDESAPLRRQRRGASSTDGHATVRRCSYEARWLHLPTAVFG